MEYSSSALAVRVCVNSLRFYHSLEHLNRTLIARSPCTHLYSIKGVSHGNFQGTAYSSRNETLQEGRVVVSSHLTISLLDLIAHNENYFSYTSFHVMKCSWSDLLAMVCPNHRDLIFYSLGYKRIAV